MKAVVTGGAGFIGSHLAEALRRKGEVHVIDDLSLGKASNVPVGVEFHQGTILDRDLVDRVIRGADVIFHQAALPSVPRSIADPIATNQANVDGTLNILDAARRLDVKKVVLASSSSVYGDTPTLPKHEGMPPDPRSPYAVSKLSGEAYARAFYRVYGLPTTSLRYFNVYGPRQDPAGAYSAVIPRFIHAATKGQPLVIHGDGLQSRDFTFVEDVVQANLLAAQSTKANGEALNVGAGGRTNLNALASMVLRVTDSSSPITHGPPRPGDVAHSLASLDRAQEAMGYAPRVTLADGLRRTAISFGGQP